MLDAQSWFSRSSRAESGGAIEVNQPALTAKSYGAHTLITMTLPAGQDIALGPVVFPGIITADDAADPGFAPEPVYPADSSFRAIGTAQAAENPFGQILEISGNSLTVPVLLGPGEFTVVMNCLTMHELSGSSSNTIYLRHLTRS